jgi:hypothetical protein
MVLQSSILTRHSSSMIDTSSLLSPLIDPHTPQHAYGAHCIDFDTPLVAPDRYIIAITPSHQCLMMAFPLIIR